MTPARAVTRGPTLDPTRLADEPDEPDAPGEPVGATGQPAKAGPTSVVTSQSGPYRSLNKR